jgi:hypothetical protein
MFRIMALLALAAAGSSNLSCQPAVVAVLNSASFQAGLPAGGALATAYISGLTALKPGTYVAPSSQPLPHILGGITVMIDNDYAPLLAVIVPSDPSAYVQVNFQVPLSANASLLYPYFSLHKNFGVGPTYLGYLSVSDGVNYAEPTTTLTTSGLPEWGGFFSGANGNAIARHATDSSLVTSQNPAHPGESIIAYADGFFMTWPRPPIGIPAPAQVTFQPDYSLTASPGYLYLQAYPTPSQDNPGNGCAPIPGICVTTGSATSTPALKINFMGLAAGSVGVEEISFVVPPNQPSGNFALFFNSGSCPDGSGIPGTCGAAEGISSPYVMLPVGSMKRLSAPLLALAELAEIIGDRVGVTRRHGFRSCAADLVGVLVLQFAAKLQLKALHLRQHFVAQALR